MAWDESVQGDLSNSFEAPSMITIDKPGEYVIRASTGPMIPTRRETLANGGGGGIFARMDKNLNGRIEKSEAIGNFAIHFETYDLNNDGDIEASESAQFVMGGDGSDVFNFVQKAGINLVAIRLTEYDSGGPLNDGSVLVLIDHDDSGKSYEAVGVEFTDDEHVTDIMAPTPDMVAAIVMVNPDGGTEIYAEYDMWKSYRRNDNSVVWRIGEGQEKATTELVFIFK